MFNFFRKNPTLAELIPNGYIDIHSHILPGIDDGAKNLEETVFLLDKMSELGFEQCIATPHSLPHVWDNTKEDIHKTYNNTLEKLPANLKHKLPHAASEYMLEETFLKRMEDEPLLTISENYVLVEMSYLNPSVDLKNIVFELQIKEYKPILAHPERYLFYHNNLREYEKLKDAGCLFQLNLLSTVGYYGKNIATTAEHLLKNNLIDFVGSDIHHGKHIEAFQNKIAIKSQKELTMAMERNSIFKK